MGPFIIANTNARFRIVKQPFIFMAIYAAKFHFNPDKAVNTTEVGHRTLKIGTAVQYI